MAALPAQHWPRIVRLRFLKFFYDIDYVVGHVSPQSGQVEQEVGGFISAVLLQYVDDFRNSASGLGLNDRPRTVVGARPRRVLAARSRAISSHLSIAVVL